MDFRESERRTFFSVGFSEEWWGETVWLYSLELESSGLYTMEAFWVVLEADN